MPNGTTTRSPGRRCVTPDPTSSTIAHRLVPEDVALVEEHPELRVQVQVRAADGGRRDPDDRVGRLLEGRVRHALDGQLLGALPGQCPHRALLVVVPACRRPRSHPPAAGASARAGSVRAASAGAAGRSVAARRVPRARVNGRRSSGRGRGGGRLHACAAGAAAQAAPSPGLGTRRAPMGAEPVATPLGSFVHRPAEDRWSWSDELYAIHGLTPGEVVPTTALVESHRHPEDRARGARAARRRRCAAGARRRVSTASSTPPAPSTGSRMVVQPRDAAGTVWLEGHVVDLTVAAHPQQRAGRERDAHRGDRVPHGHRRREGRARARLRHVGPTPASSSCAGTPSTPSCGCARWPSASSTPPRARPHFPAPRGAGSTASCPGRCAPRRSRTVASAPSGPRPRRRPASRPCRTPSPPRACTTRTT